MKDHILKNIQKCAAVITSTALLFALSSCSTVSYQSEADEIENIAEVLLPKEGQDIEIGMLATSSDVQPEDVKDESKTKNEVTVSILGDILLDEYIIYDAASRAGEGKSYSFLTLYTGIYRDIKDADLSMCSYSTAASPINSWTFKTTPVESLAALESVGFDVLETTGSTDCSSVIESYSMKSVNSGLSSADCVKIIEKNGLSFGFLALGGKGSTQSYLSGSYEATIANAKRSADVDIVSVDWDDYTSAENMKSIAAKMASAGADVIVGNADGLGNVDWISNSNGTKTLVAYSLGNLVATSTSIQSLCGGMLHFTVKQNDDGLSIGGVVLEPTLTFFSAAGGNYLVKFVGDCDDSLLSQHGVWGVTKNNVLKYIRSNVAAEFLPADIRG